jgi:predicted dehydrogenase
VNPFQSTPVAVFTEQPTDSLPEDLLQLSRPEGWWGEWRPGWMSFWPPRRDTFQAQYESFFASIREGEPAAVTGEDGYRALEIVLAAYLSLQERRPVRLPLDPQALVPPPRF